MGGLGSVPDGTYRASGMTSGAGGATSGASGGSAGGPNLGFDASFDARDGTGAAPSWPDAGVFPPPDGSVPVDVGNLGGAACGEIEYPAAGFYGPNLLDPSLDHLKSDVTGSEVEVAAKLGPNASLTIALLVVIPFADGISIESDGDFHARTIDALGSMILVPKFQGQLNERGLVFRNPGRLVVEYFECGATTPTGTKMITWAP
jgi:hypothetical protein